MFNITELKKMRSIIDQFVPTDDVDAMEIREKLCDLIRINKAWNSGEHIACTII